MGWDSTTLKCLLGLAEVCGQGEEEGFGTCAHGGGGGVSVMESSENEARFAGETHRFGFSSIVV